MSEAEIKDLYARKDTGARWTFDFEETQEDMPLAQVTLHEEQVKLVRRAVTDLEFVKDGVSQTVSVLLA